MCSLLRSREHHQLKKQAQDRFLLRWGAEYGPPTMADCDLLVEGNSELNFTVGIYLHLKAMQLAVHLSTLKVFCPLFYPSDELRAYER